MKNFNIKRVLKIVFSILIIPILLAIKFLINDNYQNSLLYNLANYIINVSLILVLFLIPLSIVLNHKETKYYKQYNLENPDKMKISWLVVFIIFLICFSLPYIILIPFNVFLNNPVSFMAYCMMFLTLLVFFFLIGYKLITDYNAYGKRIFPDMKIQLLSSTDILASEIGKIDSYQKMLVFKNHIIAINEAGIFEFVTSPKKVKIVGNVDNEYVLINDKKQKNPFVVKGANYFFILDNNVRIEMSGIRLVTKRNLHVAIEKYLNKKIYKQEDIDRIYQELEAKYGNNQNEVH